MKIQQTAAEIAADKYPVGKLASDGGTLAQKLERINIKYAFISGFESRQPEVDALKEQVEAWQKQCLDLMDEIKSPRTNF